MAIFLLLGYGRALRRSEVVQLDLHDFDPRGGRLSVAQRQARKEVAQSRRARAADYCFGQFLINVAISSDKQATHERAHELAGKHRLGLFEASSPNGEIWLPGAGTMLVLASRREEPPQNQKRITDPRIAGLVAAHLPRWCRSVGLGLCRKPEKEGNRSLQQEQPDRCYYASIVVVPQRALVVLESALAVAGIDYAVVEEDQQRAFSKVSSKSRAGNRGSTIRADSVAGNPIAALNFMPHQVIYVRFPRPLLCIFRKGTY